MRVTSGSSVVVAAHIRRAGTRTELLEQDLLGPDRVLSELILGEPRDELSGKFGDPDAVVRAVISPLRRTAERVPPGEIPLENCRDRDDLKIPGTESAGRREPVSTPVGYTSTSPG